jgi:hypothetical protein
LPHPRSTSVHVGSRGLAIFGMLDPLNQISV